MTTAGSGLLGEAATAGCPDFTCKGAAATGAVGGLAITTAGLGAGAGFAVTGSGATGVTLQALMSKRVAMPTMDNAVRRFCNAYSRKLG